MIRAGILSDTHINRVSEEFRQGCLKAFSDCDIIIHAGDLTETAILEVFRSKEVHAVHGNMCSLPTKQALPALHTFTIAGFLFGLTHGAGGPRHSIVDHVYNLFPEADCIIFGHTHQPLVQRVGNTLLVNPGSFQGTGRYGAPGTYCILSIDTGRLEAKIHDRVT